MSTRAGRLEKSAAELEIMSDSEIEAWVKWFAEAEEEGVDLEQKVPTALWQVKGMIDTIVHLRKWSK